MCRLNYSRLICRIFLCSNVNKYFHSFIRIDTFRRAKSYAHDVAKMLIVRQKCLAPIENLCLAGANWTKRENTRDGKRVFIFAGESKRTLRVAPVRSVTERSPTRGTFGAERHRRDAERQIEENVAGWMQPVDSAWISSDGKTVTISVRLSPWTVGQALSVEQEGAQRVANVRKFACGGAALRSGGGGQRLSRNLFQG